jgi:hypothetical protein
LLLQWSHFFIAMITVACMTMCHCARNTVGRDSSVGITTRYGLDGPRIESRWGAWFSAPAQTSPRAHPSSYTIDTGSFLGVGAEARRWPSAPSSAEVKERVELYIYALSGPSWPVIGCTLLYFTLLYFTSLCFASLRFTPLHSTSPHFNSLHLTLPHFTPLYFTLLHFTSLHFTSLYFTLLETRHTWPCTEDLHCTRFTISRVTNQAPWPCSNISYKFVLLVL